MLFLAEVGTMDLKVNRIATLGHMHTVRRESEGVCVAAWNGFLFTRDTAEKTFACE